MAVKKVVDGKEIMVDTFVEFNGMQICVEELVSRAKEAFIAGGNKIQDVDNVKIYINANERRAYYVINDNPQSKFIEF